MFALQTVFGFAAFAQSDQPVPAEVLIRNQLGSIAQEIVGRSKPDPSGRVVVSVEGERLKSAAENAFLEAFTKAGFQTALGSAADSAGSILRLLLLDGSVSYDEISGGRFRRQTKSVLEARLEQDRGNRVSLIGTFSREHIDTVASRSDRLPWKASSEETTFDHLFGPIILIASSIAIIYLLFTVRS